MLPLTLVDVEDVAQQPHSQSRNHRAGVNQVIGTHKKDVISFYPPSQSSTAHHHEDRPFTTAAFDLAAMDAGLEVAITVFPNARSFIPK